MLYTPYTCASLGSWQSLYLFLSPFYRLTLKFSFYCCSVLQESGAKMSNFLKGCLLEYQQFGQAWLSSMHEQKINAVMADECTRGMVVQVVAFLASCAEAGEWGPHLIVLPSRQLAHWEIKLKTHCPRLKILAYYGTDRERRLKRSVSCHCSSIFAALCVKWCSCAPWRGFFAML